MALFALIVVLVLVAAAYFAWKGGYLRVPGSEKASFPSEVYLLTLSSALPNLASASAEATKRGGVVASPQQIQSYIASGGSAVWRGITSTGDVLTVPGANISALPVFVKTTGLGEEPVPAGVWVFGPKPGRRAADARGIQPFSCDAWFQPA